MAVATMDAFLPIAAFRMKTTISSKTLWNQVSKLWAFAELLPLQPLKPRLPQNRDMRR